MKLASCFGCGLPLVTLFFLSGVLLGGAETPARSRGNTIIFSDPKNDTVSSNLTELRAPASPFREMESTLSKPFELFEPGKSRPPQKFVPPPPAPEVRKRPMKDILNARAEEMFLDPNRQPGETDSDLFSPDADTPDSAARKPMSALDRYYDRMDRVLTNRPAAENPLSSTPDTFDPLNRNNLNPFAPDRALINQRPPSDNKLNPFSIPENDRNNSRDSLFGVRDPERSPTLKPVEAFSGYRAEKENRLDAFKRLLEGPSQNRSGNPPPNNSGSYRGASASASTRPPAYASPTTLGTSTKPTPGLTPANSFNKSAGLVGAPGTIQGLPDYTAASSGLNSGLSTPPPKPLPAPSFSVPKRRF